MLKTDPDSLREEVKAAEDFRDKFTKRMKTLIQRYHGRWFRTDDVPDVPIAENFAFQYLSLMMPMVAYGAPRCQLFASDPGKKGMPDPMAPPEAWNTTMGDIAEANKLALNHWSINSNLGDTLIQLAVDYFFTYGVACTSYKDQPGYRGSQISPKQPYVQRLSQSHFFLDPRAKDSDPTCHNGPRFMGHMWKADKDDLLNNPMYDPKVVEGLIVDSGLDKYDGPSHAESNNPSGPKRGEVLCWDIWVPENHLSSDPSDNGAIHTIACGVGGDGPSKATLELCPPRPYYGPPTGPYTIFGAYTVPDCPYPLGPIAATAEKADALNAHESAKARDAGAFKRFLVAAAGNAGDETKLANVQHGEAVAVQEPERTFERTIGGVDDKQYQYNQDLRESMDRESGITDAMRGNVTGDATATENSIAQGGATARLAFLQSRYRRSVQQIFTNALWFNFYGEDMVYTGFGDEGQKTGIKQYMGGIYPGQENLSPHELQLVVEPYSLEHTSSGVIQRRMTDAVEMLAQIAPMMVQAPYINWKKLLDQLLDVMNIGAGNDIIRQDVLSAITGVQLQQQMMQQMPPPTGAAPSGKRSRPSGQPDPMQQMRQTQNAGVA